MSTVYYAELDANSRVVSVLGLTGPPSADGRAHVLIPNWTGWPTAPSSNVVLAYRNGQFAWDDPRTLAQARQQKLDALKASRDGLVYGGFAWSGSTFDSDEVAQSRMLGAYVASSMQGFQPVAWRLADNTWRTLSAVDLGALYAALQLHLRTQFAKFATFEAAINAATTLAAVDAVTWS